MVHLHELCIITPVINSPRYKTRIENYTKFKMMCHDAGVDLFTVEVAFGDRPFEVTANPYSDSENVLQFRTVEELWHKENMINVGIGHVMQVRPDVKYIAWIDADCFPISITAHEWFEKTWHALQHYQFVQMWQYLIDFGPDGQPISPAQLSFMATYEANGFTLPPRKELKRAAVKGSILTNEYQTSVGAPGLAWAASVDAINKVGRLIDYAILGSGDWFTALALVGGIDPEKKYHEVGSMSRYLEKILHWQTLAERHIKRDVGYVPVTLGHWFHGVKQNRFYGSRTKILIDNNYNPDTDIKYDCYGLLQLETWEPRQIVMRDHIRNYFRSRNEDSVPLR